MARRYALVVAISEYKSPLNPLSKPASDAEAVATVLEQFGDFQDVTVLKGSVTSTKLNEALRTLLLERAENNDVLIYFTGHGIPVVDPLRGKPNAYLATSDTIVTLEGKQAIEARRAVPFDSLNDLIQESLLSSLVMLLDSCHSGDFLERSLVEKTFTAFSTHKDYYLITACRGFEQAYAIKREQHSIFTGALLEGLSERQADEDGKVTGDRLAAFIKRELRGSGQEPISLGIGGAITLVSYGKQAITTQIDETCPYQGLEPFTEATQQFFFGRKSVVEQLRQELERSSFVALIGASGSGKSSVVRAGLIPWLKEAGWRVLDPIKPGFEPLSELKRVFASQFRRRDEIQQVYEAFNSAPTGVISGSLDTIVALLPGNERVLLVVDQFEEVFTVCPNEQERRSLIDCITQLQASRLRVVITMRADFLEPCLDYANLTQQLQQHTVLIPPLQGKTMEEAIVKPAQQQGYRVEPALLRLMQRDVAQEKNCLPLLQFTLSALWNSATEAGHQLMLDHYEQLGGITGALNRHADRVYDYQDWREATPRRPRNSQEQDWIKRLCLKLVRTGEGNRDTRQRRPKADLLGLAGEDAETQAIVEAVLADLVDGRLLVTDQAESNQSQGELSTFPAFIDLAHEALMDGWTRFAEWRKADREVRRLVDRMEDARREWEHQNRHIDFLLSKGLLTQIKLQEASIMPYFTSQSHKFYALSKDHEQQQSDALEWTKTEAALIARAREAKNLLTTRPIEGLLQILKLVGACLRERGEPISAIQDALRSAMELCREQNCLYGHQGDITCVAYHLKSTIIASGSDDGMIKLWNQTGKLLQEFFNGRHRSSVTALEFSPDGQFLASAGDRLFRFYDLNGGQIGEVFQGHWDEINSLSFSPNGQSIVSGSRDGTLRLWNLAGNPIGQPFRGHRGTVFSVHFSPDGEAIASSSADGTIRLWDIQGKPIKQPFEGHQGAVRAVRFSPDGQTIVSGGSDRTIRLWDTQGNAIGTPLEGHTDAIQWVTFSPDGKTIASASVDKTLRLWDLRGKACGTPLIGHGDLITSLAFSPDGSRIVSGSHDNTIRFWDVQSTNTPMMRHEDAVRSIAFSPNGKLIVSGDIRGSTYLWNTQGILQRQAFQAHEGAVRSLAFSPDSKLIVSGGSDGKIRLWDSQGNLIDSPFEGHREPVESVAFSPNGELIISGGKEGAIQLWDVQGSQIRRFWWNYEDKLQWNQGAVWSVAFSPDSKTIANTSSDEKVWLRDLQGNPIGRGLQGHEGAVWSVAFHPSGKLIVTGGNDRTVRLWNIQGNPIGQPFQGHEGAVWSVAFHPSGELIVSGDNDGAVRLWDIQGNPIGRPLEGHKTAVRSVAFSSDGKIIGSASDDHTIRLWTGGTWEDWLATCCNRVRYHPYFTNPQTGEARAAYEVCRKYIWEKPK